MLLYVWQVLHPMEIKYVLLKGHGTNHGFSFTPIFPLLSTIPNLYHSFSVHLMNCYFQVSITDVRNQSESESVCLD